MGKTKKNKVPMSVTGEFGHREIIFYCLGTLLLGVVVGLAFGDFKKMKYNIYDVQLTTVGNDYKKHQDHRNKLADLIEKNIVTQITTLKKKKIFHKCHKETINHASFGEITWDSKPQVIIGQTKMTVSFANGVNSPIYDAKPKVTLATDWTYYDVEMPPQGNTEICVLFVPAQ